MVLTSDNNGVINFTLPVGYYKFIAPFDPNFQYKDRIIEAYVSATNDSQLNFNTEVTPKVTPNSTDPFEATIHIVKEKDYSPITGIPGTVTITNLTTSGVITLPIDTATGLVKFMANPQTEYLFDQSQLSG